MHTTPSPLRRSAVRRPAMALLAALLLVTLLPVGASAQPKPSPDPRIGLTPGLGEVAGQAIWNLEKLASLPRPPAVNNTNSDLAFTGDYAISGNYNGINIYNVADPAAPVLVTSMLCPGPQSDVSVYGDLLFVSVQSGARVDCSTDTTVQELRGVRIFDISDITAPEHVGVVQTCKGSHTHTLVTDPNDDENVYIYNSGTSGSRGTTGGAGWPGCEAHNPSPTPIFDENFVRYSVEIIKVPLAAPQNAAVVNEARLFRDPATGALNGLQNSAPAGGHPCSRDADPNYFCAPAGAAYSPGPVTHTCHDITAYPALGIAAGACQGNGILIDISDPANPTRIDAVADQNFSYWHSATINNDGTKVLFTDEWGGGTGARCMPNHRMEWGANAIYDIVDGKMEFASYYKLPVPQTAQETCVAHNGNLIPVPNRDIMVQAWYQGGLSIFDFTDSANPVEIGYFDRGPTSLTDAIAPGGFWSTYWHNGFIYGNEHQRGFDTFRLVANERLTQNEIDVASSVLYQEANAQHQDEHTWEVTFTYGRAHVDQLARDAAITEGLESKVRHALDMAEDWIQNPRKRGPALSHLDRAISLIEWQIGVINKGKPQGDADRLAALQASIQELRDSL